VKPSVKPVPEATEDVHVNGTATPHPPAEALATDSGSNDEDDRRTIRAQPSEDTTAEDMGPEGGEESEGKREINGQPHGNVVLVADRSKEHKLVVTVSPSSPAPPVVT
jgi:hypothetical protein